MKPSPGGLRHINETRVDLRKTARSESQCHSGIMGIIASDWLAKIEMCNSNLGHFLANCSLFQRMHHYPASMHFFTPIMYDSCWQSICGTTALLDKSGLDVMWSGMVKW